MLFNVLHLLLETKTEQDPITKKEVMTFCLREEYHLVPMTMAFALSYNAYRKAFVSDHFVVVHTNDDVINRAKCPKAQQLLDEIAEKGYQAHGETFKPIFISASQARQAQFTTIADSVRDKFDKWAYLGFDKSKFMPLSPNKRAKYLGLYFSSVKYWHEIWKGDVVLEAAMPYPSFHDIAVLRDIEVSCPGIFDHVLNREIVRKLRKEHKNKITDGVAFYVIDDTGLTDEQRTELARKLRTFSFRAPWMKGYMCLIFKTALEDLIKHRAWDPIVKDFWKNEVNLLNKKIITFGSVFKAAKCFNNYEEYAEAATKYGHQIFICVEDHGMRKNGIPYQQMQTLPLNDEEIEELSKKTAGKLYEAVQSGSFHGFMRTNLGKSITEYNSLLQNPIIWDLAQQTYANQRRRMAGGRLPRAAHNLFVAIDPVAIFEGIFGAPIKGVLKADTCYTRVYKFGHMLDATRSPHLDHAHKILRNTAVPSWARGFFLGNGIFCSSHDNTMVLLQMDFDGDHLNVTDWTILIEAAQRGWNKYNNVPLFYEANDANGEVDSSDYENQLNDICRHSASAPIGVYVNALTKYWAHGYHAFQVAMLTRAGNGTIDSFGHGADKDASEADKCVADIRKRKLPMFLWYAHGHVSQSDTTKIEGPRKDDFQRYCTSGVEKLSAMALTTLPADMQEIIDPDKFDKFDSRVLQCDPSRVVGSSATPMLVKEQVGLFNRLAAATMAELELINRDSSLKAMPEYEELRRSAIRDELIRYAEDHGLTEDDVIDALILNILYKTKRSDSFAPTLVRVLFLTYGDRILANIQTNLGHAVTESAAEDSDLTNEVSENEDSPYDED